MQSDSYYTGGRVGGFHVRSNPKLSDILNSSEPEGRSGSGVGNEASKEGKRSYGNREGNKEGSYGNKEGSYKSKEDKASYRSLGSNNANFANTRIKKEASSQNEKIKNEDTYLISTSSPEGIAAASQITPSRIARILLSEGPLPIRRLTSQLISEVPAFGHLSLSKQRRLIMAALETGDPAKNCVFDKIGWGQWEAKVVPASQFAARVAAANSIAASSKSGSGIAGSTAKARRSSSVSSGAKNAKSPASSSLPLRRRRRRTSDKSSASPNGALGSTPGTIPGPGGLTRPLTVGQMAGLSSSAPSDAFRRESITNPSTDLHNLKVPGSPSLQPLRNLRNSLRARNLSLDEAIESSSDEDDDVDTAGSSPNNEEAGVFSFENGESSSVRSILRTRSLSGSNSRRPSFGGVAKPRKPRSSFTSHTIGAALDEGALDAGHQRLSFSNPSSVSRQSYLRTAIPRRGPPRQPRGQLQPRAEEAENFTDEEDWEAIGASSLRNGNHSASSLSKSPSPAKDANQREMNAAIALMNLHTVS